MSGLLQKMVQHRLTVAAAGFILAFLGMHAAFLLTPEGGITLETQVSRAGASVELQADPSLETMFLSPVFLTLAAVVAVLIVGWLAFSAKAARWVDRDPNTLQKR